MTDTTDQRPDLRQPAYYAGQLLTADQLNGNLGNEWERRWTHNRALHGTGIVSGLTVDAEIATATLTVEPGHAIDPHGRELILSEPRVLQVPPLPGTRGNGSLTPASVVLVIRWQETPAAIVTSGPCGTQGAAAWLETPVLEFVAESEYPLRAGDVIALATVGVAECVIYELDFARRRVLGGRPLPYVDAGVFRPAPLDWQLVQSSDDPALVYGLRVTADTSIASFNTTPTYQVRLAGRRWGELTLGGSTTPFMLWTPEPNVVASTSTSVEVEIIIPTVDVYSLVGSEAPTGFDWICTTLATLIDWLGGEAELLELIADTLEWSITWVGVEGTL